MATITAAQLRGMPRRTLHALADDLINAQVRGIEVDAGLSARVAGEVERRLFVAIRFSRR